MRYAAALAAWALFVIGSATGSVAILVTGALIILALICLYA